MNCTKSMLSIWMEYMLLTKNSHLFFFSDGAGRSGTYIAISNLVDRVKVVQVTDVFQCIKLIRTRRPQFVETAVSTKS